MKNKLIIIFILLITLMKMNIIKKTQHMALGAIIAALYVVLTLVEFLLLILGGMIPFEALCTDNAADPRGQRRYTCGTAHCGLHPGNGRAVSRGKEQI